MAQASSRFRTKLTAYLSALSGVGGFTPEMNAQIVYRDVRPDTALIGNAIYDIDLNGDGLNDLSVEVGTNGYSAAVHVVPAAGNAVRGTKPPFNFQAVASALSAGDTISGSGTWYANKRLMAEASTARTSTFWADQTNRYLGVRFNVSGATHYGWVRLSVAARADTVIVKDFACERTPDSAILAGALPPYDVRPAAVEAPATDCGLTGTETIRFSLVNASADLPAGLRIPLSYRLNTNTSVYDTLILTDTFASGDTISFAFDSTANLSAEKLHNLQIAAALPGDNDLGNDTLSTTVRHLPTPAGSFTVGNICVGDTLRPANTTGDSSLTYRWDFGDGSAAVEAYEALHVYDTFGAYTVSLITENRFGCRRTLTRNPQVAPVPDAAFSYPKPVCTQRTVLFSDSTQIDFGANMLQRTWDFGDGRRVENTRDVTHFYDTNRTYTVTLAVVSPFGCADTATADVSVGRSPDVDFRFDNVCLGDTTYFTNTTPSSEAFSFIWTFHDGITSESISESRYYTVADFYRVQLKAVSPDGCTDSVAYFAGVNTTDAGFTYTETADGRVNFEAATKDEAAYDWTFGGDGALIDDDKARQTYRYARNGTYTVSLAVTSAFRYGVTCRDSATEQVTVRNVSTDEELQRAGIDYTIRPYAIEINAPVDQVLRAAILNLQGQTIAETELTGHGRLSLRDLPNGSYVLLLTNGTQLWRTKITHFSLR